jgi:hypothetical protein
MPTSVYTQEDFWYSFLLEVELTANAVMWLEEVG